MYNLDTVLEFKFSYMIYFLSRYATASARSDGLLLLCGGRDANSVVSLFFVLKLLTLRVFGLLSEFFIFMGNWLLKWDKARFVLWVIGCYILCSPLHSFSLIIFPNFVWCILVPTHWTVWSMGNHLSLEKIYKEVVGRMLF